MRRGLADARAAAVLAGPSGASRPAAAAVRGDHADLLVVGGGYSGLWAALLAKQRIPAATWCCVEAGTCGWAASGRNGGFCAASLTHGLANGVEPVPRRDRRRWRRWAGPTSTRIGCHGGQYDIDCDFERTGELEVATAAVPAGRPGRVGRAGPACTATTSRCSTATRCGPRSTRRPTSAALWDQDRVAMLDPARLAWGLRRACLDARRADLRAHPGDRAGPRRRRPCSPAAHGGSVRAARVALATNAFPPLLRRLRAYLVPVYDYALMTRAADGRRAATRSAGATGRGSATPATSSTTTGSPRDDRILFGGYDAIYHFGNRMAPALEQRAATFETLAAHFFDTFPQLADVALHAIAGAASSTPAPGSARSSARRTAAGWRTPPATPGSASAPPASAPG